LINESIKAPKIVPSQLLASKNQSTQTTEISLDSRKNSYVNDVIYSTNKDFNGQENQIFFNQMDYKYRE
jgi:hypothetical protein